jgi:phosphate transport system substrate-binding protein
MILFVLFVSAAVCFVSAPASSGETIKYLGCDIVKKAFMAELVKAFTKETGTQVEVRGGGDVLGIRKAAAGITSLGGACRHVIKAPEEKDAKLHHVAWDAVVVIVNKENPVDSITLEQLKGVITGNITDWGQLGGPANTPIQFFVRNGKISGVGRMARELIFYNPEQEFKAVKRFKSTTPLEKGIMKEKWAIGLTGISSARKRDVKVLKLSGIDTSKENIASGKYLLYRPLYLVTRGEPKGAAKEFITFAKSPKGQQIISSQGTVTLKEGAHLWPVYREQMTRLKMKAGEY